MRIRVKICGITTPEDALAAATEGADAVGFVFAESPRQVSVERALEVSHGLPPFVSRVAVMSYPEPDQLAHVLAKFKPDILQAELDNHTLRATEATNTPLLPVLHDDDSLAEQLDRLDAARLPFRTAILEGPGRGGRGVSPDWSHAAALAKRMSLVLAGGLRVDNIASAIRTARPFAVDVSSGVEDTPGRKDPHLIAAFMTAVRRAEHDLDEAIQT